MASPFLVQPTCPLGTEFCPVLAEMVRLKTECQRLLELSQTDPLTGLYNWRHFMSELDREMERTQRTGLPTGLVMIDLDYFKRINDTFGHLCGDAVLRKVSLIWQHHIRKLDVACRYGGEEFAIILPATNFS